MCFYTVNTSKYELFRVKNMAVVVKETFLVLYANVKAQRPVILEFLATNVDAG